MATDPFNSAGGYSVGIPPIPVLDGNGVLTVASASIGEVRIYGDTIATGNFYADTFHGKVIGNIEGNLILTGANSALIYNNNQTAESFSDLIVDPVTHTVTMTGTILTTTLTVGTTQHPFASSTALTALTSAPVPNQVLLRTHAADICSIDYTIIATDRTANIRQTSKLFGAVLGTEVSYYEYGTIDVPITSPGVTDFKVTYDSGTGDVLLTTSPISINTIEYKILVTSYNEA